MAAPQDRETVTQDNSLTPERFARVRAVFEAAVERPASERRAFAAGACGGDAALLREVERMLAADARAGGVLDGPPSSSSSAPEEGRFPAGTVLAGRYRILGLLGHGGMGEVFKAFDLILNQTVALKFLAPRHYGEAVLARFRNEVRIARQVAHPNVCRVYDLGMVEGLHFLSMEYIDGEDLASLLRRIGRLPQDKAIEFTRKICAGLSAAHGRGVLHRDLKPANIMIDGRGQVRITDFGLAGLAAEIPLSDLRSGTPAYMSPEQKAGKEVTVRSDIYSLGLTLHEIVTGKRRASTQTNFTDLVKDLDPAVERVILRCIEEDPKLRPSSALRVAMALPGGDPIAAALAAGETPSPEMVAASAEKEGFSPRIAVLCFASLVASLIVLALFLQMGDLLTKAPINIPPEVLAFRAEEMLKEFGYNKPPRSVAYGFDCCDASNLQYVYRQDPARRDEVLASDQPALVRFWYRRHQDPFFAGSATFLASSNGTVRYDFPPNTEPGMVRVVLDARGRLIGLEARPAASGAGRPGSNAASFAWSSLFRHAGLDASRFSTATPRQIPPMAFDSRMAWVGTYAEGRPEQVRIEAALWEGSPVYFDVAGDWHVTSESIGDIPPQLAPVWAFLFVLIVGGGALVARHNLKLGRCDRKGAAQLAGAYLLSAVCSWILTAAHMAAYGEIGLMVSAIAVAAFPAAMLWLAYLAIEPYVRRHWPDSLISWTRFQTGRLRDPLVATHVLVGFLIITGVKASVLPIVLWGSPFPPQQFAIASLSSTAYFAANLLGGSVRSALEIGVAFLLIVVLLRMLLRRVWIADMVGSFLFGLTSGGANLSSPLRFTITAVAIALGSYLILLLLRRFGLLAMLAAWLAYSLTTVVPVSFTSWYAGRALVAYGTIVAAAAWALWVVVSQRRPGAEPAE